MLLYNLFFLSSTIHYEILSATINLAPRPHFQHLQQAPLYGLREPDLTSPLEIGKWVVPYCPAITNSAATACSGMLNHVTHLLREATLGSPTLISCTKLEGFLFPLIYLGDCIISSLPQGCIL